MRGSGTWGLHVASVMQRRPSQGCQLTKIQHTQSRDGVTLPRALIPSLHKPSPGPFKQTNTIYRMSNFLDNPWPALQRLWYASGVFDPPLAFCKPTSVRDSDPGTITLGWKTWFCPCRPCLTWLPGLNGCAGCKSAPRTPLMISVLSTETAP